MQLVVKVTLNNRGTVPVYVGGSLMRVTAFTKTSGERFQLSDAFESSTAAPAREYRDEPWSLSDSKLLFANDIIRASNGLNSGQSTTIKKAIDFDARVYRVARFTVEAIFVNNDSVAGANSCFPPQVSSRDDEAFAAEVSKVHSIEGKEYLCREIQMKPTNVVHKLVGDRQTLRIETVLREKNQPSAGYPTLPKHPIGGNALLPPTLMYKNTVAEYSPFRGPNESKPDVTRSH